jgi:predicted lipoprotein with Yx(FWY)xxD motif
LNLVTSTESGRHPAPRRRLRGGVVAALAAGAAALPLLAGTASAAAAARPAASAAAARGTVVAAVTNSFGTSLVVGSGRFAGFTLYFITSDHGTSFGCTSKPVTTPIGRLLCTGPPGGKSEWPAITTAGRPVAGPGVSQRLLGTVRRAGIGEQVTYAGHPLYLFDQGPGQVTGEGWDEPTLPPWHGVWYLMSPSGRALPWAGTLTTMRIRGRRVLATPMLTGVGWIDFPVYGYSRDSRSRSTCTGACARAWPPVLTSGRPGLSGGLSAGRLGVLRTPEGLQVRYGRRPLYVFAFEGVTMTATGFATTGSGNGIRTRGGIFRLVAA